MLARWAWFVLFIALLLIGLPSAGCAGKGIPVARVNGQEITLEELESFIRLMQLYNPDLEGIMQAQKDKPEMRKVWLEFLQILIDMELVRQEAERLALPVDLSVLKQKTGVLIDRVASTHYRGMPELFHQKREQLKLNQEELKMISRHELMLKALFDYLGESLTEEDLLQFVEENPEMLRQAASVKVFRLVYVEEKGARSALEKLNQGMPVQEYLLKHQHKASILEAEDMGWVTQDNPFIEPAVIDFLFSLLPGSRGEIVKTDERYLLYWIQEARPTGLQNFEQVRDQVLFKKQYTLYQDYFISLWNKGEIEILYFR